MTLLGGMRSTCTVLVRHLEGMRLVGRPRHRALDNMKVCLIKIKLQWSEFDLFPSGRGLRFASYTLH
jgi:hypothetical protein